MIEFNTVLFNLCHLCFMTKPHRFKSGFHLQKKLLAVGFLNVQLLTETRILVEKVSQPILVSVCPNTEYSVKIGPMFGAEYLAELPKYRIRKKTPIFSFYHVHFGNFLIFFSKELNSQN